MVEDILYTPEEIAEKLKLTNETVYEMIKIGELEAHKIGPYLRISESQFSIFLQKKNGFGNFYEGTITESNDEKYVCVGNTRFFVDTEMRGDVQLFIRPEHIILTKGEFKSSAKNCFLGKVISLTPVKSKLIVLLDIGVPIHVGLTLKFAESMDVKVGKEFYVVFKTLFVVVNKR